MSLCDINDDGVVDDLDVAAAAINLDIALTELALAEGRKRRAETAYLQALGRADLLGRDRVVVSTETGPLAIAYHGPSKTWLTSRPMRLVGMAVVYAALLSGLPGCCGPGWQLSYAPAPPPVVRVCQPEADGPTVTLPAPPPVPALAPPPPPALPEAIPAPPAPPLVKPSALADEDLTPRTDVWIGQAAASGPWRRPTR